MASQKATLCSLSTGCVKLKRYFHAGLGALAAADKRHIRVPATTLINGSLALDDAARQDMPDDFRWDYALDYNGEVFFIEVHPGQTSEISTMINKVEGLHRWLKDIGVNLLLLPPVDRKFYWVSSGRTDLKIIPGSRQAKQLAMKKIVSIGTIWDYSKI